MDGLRLLRLSLVLAVASLALGAVAGGAAGAGVEPLVFSATVPLGASVWVAKTVHTPAISPVPDIYFLSDTTGSMQPAITNVQSNASTIMNSVSTAQPGAQFGAGNYKDFPFDPLDNPYAFQPNAPIGPSALAVAGINTWFADGGGDGPEGSLFALHKIATDPTIGWRPGSTRVLVWFGDAPAHDPVCTAISGLAAPLTTAGVAAELAAANIRVIAISLRTGGYLTGLNDNSALFESDYDAACGVPVGRTGQAAEIAAATGGADLVAANPGEVSDIILRALANLPVTVTPTPACDPGLTATYDAATKTVTSGTDATFSEVFHVDGGAPAGVTLHCTIDFLLNGTSQPGFQQTGNITVPPAVGTIVIRKLTVPGGDTTPFAFTGAAAGTIAGDGGTITVGNLAAGTYTSTETARTGWDLTGLACNDSDSTGSVATRTATFRLAAGETITCTFTNTKRGTIVVKKQTVPAGDPTPFTFTGDAAGTVTGDGGTISVDVAAGTYASSETVPANWELTGLACNDSDSTGSIATRTATFRVAAGETVTCTFTNTKRATIVVKSRTVPAGSTQAFAFTGNATGTIAADGGTIVVPGLAAGTYTSAETVPTGWDLTALTCDDADSTGSLVTKAATFRVVAGETVTCTFTNTKRATIVVRSKTVPAGSTQAFAFTGSVAGTIAADGGTLTAANLAPGTYTAVETVPSGWDLTALTCDDSDSTGAVATRTATFRVVAGETVTCTFTSTKRATIVVRSSTLPAGSTQAFKLTGSVAGTIATDGGTLTVGNLAPGTYTSVEGAVTGWDLTALTCDDSDSTGAVATRTATFRVVAGETVTCTFTSTKRGSIVVKQATNPSSSSQKLTYTGHPAGSIANGATITETSLVPGTYTSVQTLPGGWGLSSIVCNDANSTGSTATRTATFRLDPGETVTCTFTNTQLPAACSLGYPSGSAPALSSVVFTADQVIKAAAYLPATNQLAVWFNGPYALTTGIRQVVVKTKTGTTTTSYATTAMSANPGRIASTGLYGSTILGNGLKSPSENPQAGTDIGTWTSAYGYLDSNRPWWPGIYVTDITTNAAARTGDWQQGGRGTTPTDVFGTWKLAVKTVDQTVTPHAITVVTDAEPAKNNWTLGSGSDTPPGGFSSLQNLGYGSELRWNLASLGLVPGRAYRLQVLLHKRVDYQGQTCVNVFIPA